MSDGPWGVDDSSTGTTIDKFEISQNDDIYSGVGYRVERNITLEAKTSSYVAAYRSFTPRFKAVNLSEHKVFEFDASGTGDLEITIIKASINEWGNQFRTTIKLNELDEHFAIPLEYFISKTQSSLDLSDAVSMVFTMSSDGVEVVSKKLDLKNIEFTQRTLSIGNDIIKENESILYPNPMSLKADLSFYSEVSTSSKIEIYNITGSLIRNMEITTEIGNNNIEIFRKGLKTGLYFIKISNDFRNYNTKKLIIN
jgi:hypothetical protein